MSRESAELMGARRERMFVVAYLQYEAAKLRGYADKARNDPPRGGSRRASELLLEADNLEHLARVFAHGKHTYWPSLPPEGCVLQERDGYFLGWKQRPSTYVTGSREHVLRELWRAAGAEWLSAQVLP